MFATYILYSQRINKYYIGHTKDLERRLIEHNRGKTAFMAKGAPWSIVYSFNFQSRTEAVGLEMTIKKRGAERYLSDLKKKYG